MRYRVQSPLSNDRFLTAASRMPREIFYLKELDRRAVMFHRTASSSQPEDETVIERSRVEQPVTSREW